MHDAAGVGTRAPSTTMTRRDGVRAARRAGGRVARCARGTRRGASRVVGSQLVHAAAETDECLLRWSLSGMRTRIDAAMGEAAGEDGSRGDSSMSVIPAFASACEQMEMDGGHFKRHIAPK